MLRFLQPNRLVAQSTRKKDSSPSVAAAAAATSAVVILTSAQISKVSYEKQMTFLFSYTMMIRI